MSVGKWTLRESYSEELAGCETANELRAFAETLIDRAERFQQLWLEAEDRWRGGVGPWAKEISRLRDLLKPDGDEAARMTEALTLHFGMRVAKVQDVCDAIHDWFRACLEAKKEYDALSKDARGWRSPPPLYEIVEAALAAWMLDVGKSSYLRRRIYGGEPHRTEKCPVHKGQWCGIVPPDSRPDDCLCMTRDGELTGWIPVQHVVSERSDGLEEVV